MASNDEQPIPDGWPPGHTSLTHDGGWTWVLSVGTRQIAGADDPDPESNEGWHCCEDEARLAAHRHYRTTREYRLEQRVAELELDVSNLEHERGARKPSNGDF